MRKFLPFALIMTMAVALCGCGSSSDDAKSEDKSAKETTVEEATTAEETSEDVEEETTADDTSDAVMSYQEFRDADVDTEVTVITNVQAKQSWWDDSANVYCIDNEGAYFIYGLACTEEEYETLTQGTAIKVTGYKSEWSGEVEITDATFELVAADPYVVDTPTDLTEYFGDDDALINSINCFAAFKGLTVVASTDADGNEVPYLYNWDGSGSQGDDLYFTVSLGDKTATFTVESYLCDKDTDVYKAVEGLNVGDVIDVQCFLYWYNGANPHVTSVTVQ